MTGSVESIGVRPVRVALLRDVPEERRLSMERFADALEGALAGARGVDVSPCVVHDPSFHKRFPVRQLGGYYTRLIRYPLVASRRDAEVYHIVDQGYAHLGALLRPERTIATCHDLMLLRSEEGGTGFRGRRTSVIRFRWSTAYLRRYARVVCDSEATKRDAIRLCDVSEERLAVVYPGVGEQFRELPDLAAVRHSLPALLDHRFIVAHVSTGHSYKNVPQTLQVIAALRESGLDVVLARVGRPLNEEEAALAASLRLGDAVIELGVVSDEELVRVYNAADVLLFPSFWEGFGWPPLEAMACGTPAVVSDAASLVEVVGDAGLVAPASATRELADAVRSILESDELRAELRARGLRRASAFTWQAAAAAYAAIYREVAVAARSAQDGHGR